MSLATPSPALANAGTRLRGVVIVLICFGGFALGLIVAQILGAAATSLSGSPQSFTQLFKLDEPPWWLILSVLVGEWIGWSIAIVVLQRRFTVIRLPDATRFHARDLWGIPGAIGLQFVIAVVYAPFHIKNLDKPTHHVFGDASGVTLLVLGLVTVFVVPLFEETFFRGALLAGLRDLTRSARVALSAVAAITLDGIFFGLAHGEWVQLPALAGVGMVLAFLYWHTGRLWPNYILHASFNGVAVVALQLSMVHH